MNNEQRTVNNEQTTITNNKQQTTNNKQRTTNNEQPTTFSSSRTNEQRTIKKTGIIIVHNWLKRGGNSEFGLLEVFFLFQILKTTEYFRLDRNPNGQTIKSTHILIDK